MDYMYDYTYVMDDEFGAVFGIVYTIYYLISFGLAIATYVLGSLGLYTIAKRRGISSPWLAWIPVANAWIVGSISDQYRYVTKGQIKNKRKILLALECAVVVLGIVLAVFMGVSVIGTVAENLNATEDQVVSAVMGVLVYALMGGLGVAAVSIAAMVVRYMAMYDLYTSVNPPCNVMFLVLSIFLRITEPFFIFFNRKKDGGMPPRCDIPAAPVRTEAQYLPPKTSIQEPWENVTEE